MDVFDAETRSRVMAAVKGRDTGPELRLRRALHALGFRWRLGGRGLPGRPDLVLPKRGAAVFVHGCFWHRHPGCAKATTPATRAEFWQAKFARNVARDAAAEAALAELGWRVAVVWECALERRAAAATAEALGAWLRGSEGMRCELPAPRREAA